jgi:hypothetical protein
MIILPRQARDRHIRNLNKECRYLAGECAAGAALGTDGCTWRTVSQPKTVNDTGE